MLLALLAVCSGLLVCAQASAADPVSGALGAVGTSATQQLAAVAHDATAIALPTTPPAASAQISASAGQSVETVPQVLTGAGVAARSSASSLAEPVHASDPGESAAHSGSSDARQPSPPSSLLAAATRVERVVTSPTAERGEHAPTVLDARRIVSSRAERISGTTLAYAERHTPATHALAGHASRVAGALLLTVARVAAGARDTLTALPPPAVASLLRATTLPNLNGTGTPAALQSFGPALPAASIATIGGARAAQSSSAGELTAPLVQRSPTDRPAPGATRAGVRQPRNVASSATSTRRPIAAAHANAPATTSEALGESVPAPFTGGFSVTSSANVAGGPSAAAAIALVALLLLAAPRALRRLRPAAASWRLAQFALIPARPG